jgi:hypothetical protein
MPKALLVCLLVLLLPVDDAWARATPGPDDDAQAAENNDFLIQAAPDMVPRQDVVPTCGAVWVADDSPGLAQALVPAPAAPVGRALLYLLVSLQR